MVGLRAGLDALQALSRWRGRSESRCHAGRLWGAVALLWDLCTLADQLGEALQRAESELRLEQAVSGLDSRDELSLQSLLVSGLSSHYSVAREVHYPSTAGRRLSARQRCDIVLTPPGRPLRLDHTPPSLFDPTDPSPVEQALWLEVKTAFQFREGGARHGGYGAQWRQAVVDDLRKMEAEPMIHHAGLLLVVFNESRTVLEKDLELFELLLMQKQVLAGYRQVRSVEILDRIGHRYASIALWPTVQRGEPD